MSVTAVVVAAGRGTRMGLNKNKLLIRAGGKTIIEHTLDRFFLHGEIRDIVLVHSAEDAEFFRELSATKYDGRLILAAGGLTRSLSVKSGLTACPPDTDIVLIHDGARPFVSKDVIDRVIASVRQYGSGIAALPVSDTVGDLSGYREEIIGHLKRDKMVLIQTPQGFEYSAILDAYRNANPNINFTDDSSVYLKYIGHPRHCRGDADNTKITYREDLSRFGCTPASQLRVGSGFDAHRFQPARKLILGGIEIPHESGLLGHSDADVLCHAVMDSLLSAADLPDIGTLFPDTEDKYRGASSIRLLAAVRGMLEQRCAAVSNVSAVVIAERPKLAPHIADIRASLAGALLISPQQINVSATTTEGMGFTGRGEGIAVSSTALLTIG